MNENQKDSIADESDDQTAVSRRVALGLLGAGGLGLVTGQAAGQNQGSPPFYNWQDDVNANGHTLEDLGALAMADADLPIQDFAGENLSIDDGVLNADVSDAPEAVWEDVSGDGLLEAPEHDGIDVSTVQAGELSSGDLPVVEVDAFGATGDGQTDDTQPIEDAIASVGSDERRVLAFGSGTEYLVSSPITVDTARIAGIEGRNARLIPDGDFAVLEIKGSHGGSANPDSVPDRVRDGEMNPFLHDLRIGGTEPAGLEATAITVTNTFGLRVHGCHFYDLRNAIRFYGTNRNPILTGNNIWHCLDYGIWFDGGDLHQINVNSNHISYCRIAIYIDDPSLFNFQLTGNDIEASSSPDVVDHLVLAEGSGTVSGFHVVGNTLEDHGDLTGSMIRIDVRGTSRRFQITDNGIANANHSSIEFISQSADEIIEFNISENNFVQGNEYAVKLRGNITIGNIADNSIVDEGLVHADGVVDDTEYWMETLTIADNSMGATDVKPLVIRNTRLFSVTITGNVFRDGSGSAGYVTDISGLDYLREVHYCDNAHRIGNGESGVRIGADEETLVVVKNNTVRDVPAGGTAYQLPAGDDENVIVADNIYS